MGGFSQTFPLEVGGTLRAGPIKSLQSELVAADEDAGLQFQSASAEPKPAQPAAVTVDPDGTIHGDADDNVIDGDAGNDRIFVEQGGNDTVNALGGDDLIYYGAALTADDVNDGGDGARDVVLLQGNYVLTFGAQNLVGIEFLSLQSGSVTKWGDVAGNSYSYDLTTVDANVAAGQRLTINAQSLQANEDFTFDGSAELDGSFLIYGGRGVDTLVGGAGRDIFYFEAPRFSASDTVDGGIGIDSVVISMGNGLNTIVFGENQFTSIESISFNNKFATDPSQVPSYEIVLADGNVAAGASLIVNGQSLAANQTIEIDGSAETNGSFQLYGGAANDVLIGGAGADLIYGNNGADIMTGGAGNDVFLFLSAAQSAAGAGDTITDFTVGDRIDLRSLDADTTVDGNQDFAEIGAAAFSGTAGELRYELVSGSNWLIQGDTDGDGAADFELNVTVTDGDPIDNADFLGTMVSGSVLDGYIANGRVFRDRDGDSTWDADEEFTFTDANGNFSNLGGVGRIVLAPVFDGNGNSLTIDISTGRPFTGILSAPNGSSVVSPLTTLIDSLAGATAGDAAIAAAQTVVLTSLGLDPNLDLASYDPLAVIAAGGSEAEVAAALQVQQAAVSVANVIAVVGSALEAGGVSADSASQFVAQALATQLSTGPVDLTNSNTLTSVVGNSAAYSGVSLGGNTGAIGEALASVNGVIAEVSTSGDPLGALASIVTAQIVAQQQLAQDTQAAVSGGGTLDSGSFDGTQLADRLEDASDEVETIIPSSTEPGALGSPDRPTVDDGARINAAEAADGTVVSVSYGEASGVAAGDTLRLLVNGVEVGSYLLTAGDIPAAGGSLTHQFVLSPGALGTDGPLVLAAQFVRAGGELGAVSAPAVVQLDTTPDRPSDLRAAEGTIVTVLEGVDGTDIVGRAELGSTVFVTFTNGTNVIARQVVAGADGFSIHLSHVDLTQLGEGYVSYSVTATDVAGNPSGAPVNGQFLYTSDLVFSDQRIDGPGFEADIDDDSGGLEVTALRNGSYSLAWIVDNEDDDGGLAIQRFNADGSTLGTPFMLQGLPSQLGEDDFSGAFTALEGGGFALTYGARPSLLDSQVSAPGNPTGTVNFTVVGQPVRFHVINAPEGATYTLNGRNAADTGPASVTLTPLNGVITITQDILDQFLFDFRFNLQVSGVGTGTSVSLGLERATDMWVDLDGPLNSWSQTMTVAANGFGILGGLGRPESFQVTDATPSGSSVTYQLRINAVFGPYSVDLTGIPNATVLSNGDIQITGLVPDANGVIQVPELLLERLGTQDAQISLFAFGLAPGSTFAGVGIARALEPQLDGLYTQVFDANGVAVGPPVQIDAGARAHLGDDDGSPVGITAHADGGYMVHWVTDVDIDGDGDGLVVQRFTADGTPVGELVTLQGISSVLADAEETVFQLTPLEGGGYALAFGIEHQEGERNLGGNIGAPGGLVFFPIVGRVSEIYVGQAPAGATFSLVGRNSDNTGTASVQLTVEDGFYISIDESVFDQFLFDTRLTLQVTAPNTGPVNVYTVAEQVQVVDVDASLLTSDFSGVAANNRVTITAAGRVEAIDIDAVTPTGAAPTYQLVITPAYGYVDLTGIPNAMMIPSGQIVINNLTADANGVVEVPALLLERLGNQDVAISLNVGGLVNGSSVTATVSYRPYEAAPEGIFLQLFDADGVALTAGDTRIDTGAPTADLDDDSPSVGVSALGDGTFVVRWLLDVLPDDEDSADTVALQHYAADGTPLGSIITLSMPSTLLDAEDIAFDFAARPGGGFVVTYGVEQDDAFVQYSFGGNPNGVVNVNIVGRPQAIYVGDAPPGATFTLSGRNAENTGPANLVLTPVNGWIEITEQMLDQFLFDYRFNLAVGGMTVGTNINFGIESDVVKLVDLDAPLFERLYDVPVSGGFAIAGGHGRAEAFQVHAATPSGTSVTYQLLIGTQYGPGSVDLTGIPNATFMPNGGISISGLVPDANGIIEVPDLLLERLGNQDAQIVLFATGLTNGSTFSASTIARPLMDAPAGLFMLAFDADGTPVTAGLELTGTAGDDILVGDFGPDLIAGLGGDNVLAGGAGHDVFRFEGVLGSNRITDFDTGVDKIDLSALDADSLADGDQSFSFIGSAAFSGTAGELRATFDAAENVWLVEGDTDGAGGADFVIQVVGTALDPLAGADFVL